MESTENLLNTRFNSKNEFEIENTARGMDDKSIAPSSTVKRIYTIVDSQDPAKASIQTN